MLKQPESAPSTISSSRVFLPWDCNMRAFTYAYPTTNTIVPRLIDDTDCATENNFQGFVCRACSQLHWMNSKTRNF